MSSPVESVGPAPPRDARGVLLKIAGFAIAFRLFSAALSLIVNVVFPDYTPAPFTVFGTASPFWDAFARYDSGWYYQVARYGYTAGAGAYVPGGRSGIAYFPAYPLLMRYVGRAIGRRPADLYIGGIVVSWIAFAVALVGVYHLARLDLPRRKAERAAILTAIFPFAFFFGAVYPEALFLAATAGCFYCFRTRRWILGGLCGALATASRVNGVMMVPALAWIAWQEIRNQPTRRPELPPPLAGTHASFGETRRSAKREGDQPGRQSPLGRHDTLRAILGLALVCAGIGAYSIYIYSLAGNPFEWASAIQRWVPGGYHPGGSPISVFFGLGRALLTHPYAFLAGERLAPYDTLNGLAAVGAVVAVPFVWRRFGAGYGLFMLANLWLPLSSGVIEGLGRYVAVMFPLFIWLASLRTKVFVTTTIVFAMMYTLCLALFTNIHPLF